MSSGSCLCGNVKVSYQGEPAGKALCHCLDCRKITGSTFSTNFMIPADQFHVDAGQVKQYTKQADSGNTMVSFLCGDCGTTLWRESTKYPGVKVLKAGVLDGEVLSAEEPDKELFAPRRVKWVPQISAAEQHEATL